ncbi:lipoprotein [Leptospira paudalimensis]|uniref:Lipoprotein n=1 Tax=Leptospira paudalimensis TaxID=2950024 RepID=A0ABT3M542_9LEPT|nr:lipoprotein [Leptospira paudalimensis]MCW7503510.1 lipoprotein [Leptospira paudalimensis]
MKKRILLAYFFVACASFQNTQENKFTTDFLHLLKSNKLIIQNLKPVNYQLNMTLYDGPFKFDYALINKSKGTEIRYHINSFKDKIDKYEEFLKNNPSAFIVKPNDNSYAQDFILILMNLAGENPKIKSNPLPEKIQSDVFNANWGSNSLFEFDPKLNFSYKYCNLIVIHKNDTADAYIYFLGNDLRLTLEESSQFFENLKFIK